VELGTGKVKILKEGSWEAEKLGIWEVGELFVDAGVIFLWSLGKEGNQEDLLPFYLNFKDPEKKNRFLKLTLS
jgi:hypothetical protein